MEEPTSQLDSDRRCGAPPGNMNARFWKQFPAETRAIDLWWVGKGGLLKSVTDGGHAGGGSVGRDYPAECYLHIERYLCGDRRRWRTIADFAAAHGHDMSSFPEWETTPTTLFALGAGELISYPPALRAQRLYWALLKGLGRWLKEHPMPTKPSDWEKE